MLPLVSKLLALDVYRDGGSIGAYFSETKLNVEVEYSLLFPIHRSPAFEEDFKMYRYNQPMLDAYKKIAYTSPINGISYPDTLKESELISWSQAGILLGRIKPHLQEIKSDYLWVFEAMVRVAKSEGVVNHLN